MAFHRALTLLSVAGLVMAACAAPAASPTASPTIAPTATPTIAPTTAPTPSPSPSPNACAPENLTLKNPGRLTLSTDLPAFPPWFGGDAHQQLPNEPEGGSPWSESEFSAEPYSGLGFEGAMAYAIASEMGFSADKVDWIANPVFAQAFAPGV
jgi:polar amino acid transport system substrate-binding protein